jgi:hypothetical protein
VNVARNRSMYSAEAAMQSPSRAPAPKRSIARTSLLAMSVRISILICVTSACAYWHLHNTLTDKTKRQLADYIAQRGVRESQRFQLAESNMKRMAKELGGILAVPGTDGQATWDRVWERRPDGTYRQRTGADYEHTPTMYCKRCTNPTWRHASSLRTLVGCESTTPRRSARR